MSSDKQQETPSLAEEWKAALASCQELLLAAGRTEQDFEADNGITLEDHIRRAVLGSLVDAEYVGLNLHDKQNLVLNLKPEKTAEFVRDILRGIVEEAKSDLCELMGEECRHAHRDSRIKPFEGCTNPQECNPCAHGNICRIDTCRVCGAERETNINQLNEEVGPWEL